MDKTVTWKPQAIQQYQNLVQFLKEEYSEATADKFVEKVTAKMTQLERYPKSGLDTRFKTIRRAKVGKLNSFYYRISGARVIIRHYATLITWLKWGLFGLLFGYFFVRSAATNSKMSLNQVKNPSILTQALKLHNVYFVRLECPSVPKQ